MSCVDISYIFNCSKQKLVELGENWQNLAKISRTWDKLARDGKLGKVGLNREKFLVVYWNGGFRGCCT